MRFSVLLVISLAVLGTVGSLYQTAKFKRRLKKLLTDRNELFRLLKEVEPNNVIYQLKRITKIYPPRIAPGLEFNLNGRALIIEFDTYNLHKCEIVWTLEDETIRIHPLTAKGVKDLGCVSEGMDRLNHEESGENVSLID